MVWRTFEEYIEGGEIPISFLERNPVIHTEDGDLPEGWFFYDMREQDGADAGGYIVQGGPNMATQKKPHFTLRSLKGGSVMRVEGEKPTEPENWGHKDDMIYRLVSGPLQRTSLWQRPLNWNLFPDVLIGEF